MPFKFPRIGNRSTDALLHEQMAVQLELGCQVLRIRVIVQDHRVTQWLFASLGSHSAMNMSKKVCSNVASGVLFEIAWVIATQHDIFNGAAGDEHGS